MKDFKVYWDNENNVPVIIDEQMDDLRIKSEGLEYLTTDLRPVFLREKHLIKHLFQFEDDIYYSSVWSTKQGKYIIDGKVLKKSVISTAKGIEDIDTFRENVLSFEQTKMMEENEKKIINKFIELNKNHIFYLLESKDIDEEGHTIGAYPFVNEVIKKYSKRMPMVSFSGGKDSTVVSHIVRKATNNQSILHIFGDTTLELPETYQYVEEFKGDNPMTPFFEEKNEENNFFEMCKEIGPPSRVVAWCCSIFKTGPMGTTLSNFEEDFLNFYGVRRKESLKRSKYPKILKSTKIDKQLSIAPIIDWLDIDVWLYMLTEQIKFNDSYRYGFARVGCWVCPHRGAWSDFVTEIFNFDLSTKWKQFLYTFADNIGKTDYKKYIDDEKWKIRRGADGLKNTNKLNGSKECINEKNTYTFDFSREIKIDFISELFKPFGKIQYRNINRSSTEILILNNKKPLFKVNFIPKKNNLKITLMDLKDRYLLNKIKKQLNKYNFCTSCQACNSICPTGAITVSNGQYKIDEDKCVHCLNCVNRFNDGCIVAFTLRTKKKEN